MNSLQWHMIKSELGLSAMYRILKKSGAERVSDESANELRKIIENIAEQIAKNSVDLTTHAGRKTVKAEDVKLASKTILNMQFMWPCVFIIEVSINF